MIKIAVCTRDRPEILVQNLLILDTAITTLAGTLGLRSVDCYIFDDSTKSSNSLRLKDVVRSIVLNHIQVSIVDTERQKHFLVNLYQIYPGAKGLIEQTCKMLGTGPWDLAKTRNFAFLYTLIVSSAKDTLLFLDDDMLFGDVSYRGHHIRCDGSSTLINLYNSVSQGGYLAAGVAYWGRKDVSIIEHLNELMETLLQYTEKRRFKQAAKILEDLEDFPSTLPIILNLPSHRGNSSIGIGPKGISGAVLGTSQESLCSHFLPSVYNEDFIWLTLLPDSPRSINRVSPNVVHAAPSQSPITIEFLVYQEYGEIVYQTVHLIAAGSHEYPDKVKWVKENLHSSVIGTRKAEQLAQMKSLIQKIDLTLITLKNDKPKYLSKHVNSQGLSFLREHVHEVFQKILLYDEEQIEQQIVEYLHTIDVWRSFMSTLRQVPSSIARLW